MESDLEDELSVGVAEYLKEWGLSQFTITNFEENQISFKLLDCIQATELKELIPNFKERILLNQLQNIIHTTESDKTLSVDSDFSAPSTTASTSSNEVADHEREISYVGDFCYCAAIGFKIFPAAVRVHGGTW
ncbi:uncharacterized protein [Choristoneura fumiferana]|uniref:uncharacterized protein n=1 Tax=Choristoneura fumiferana TaxID=7141 RepID=UPI003D159623